MRCCHAGHGRKIVPLGQRQHYIGLTPHICGNAHPQQAGQTSKLTAVMWQQQEIWLSHPVRFPQIEHFFRYPARISLRNKYPGLVVTPHPWALGLSQRRMTMVVTLRDLSITAHQLQRTHGTRCCSLHMCVHQSVTHLQPNRSTRKLGSAPQQAAPQPHCGGQGRGWTLPLFSLGHIPWFPPRGHEQLTDSLEFNQHVAHAVPPGGKGWHPLIR